MKDFIYSHLTGKRWDWDLTYVKCKAVDMHLMYSFEGLFNITKHLFTNSNPFFIRSMNFLVI